MMMKMKAAAAAATVGSSSPYAAAGAGYDDPRIRFKHESLMQDYEELLKETEAKRKRLEMMKQRKMTLMAEVSFLRRRFEYFTETQTQNPKPEQKLLPSQTTVINKSKKARNKKTISSNHKPPASASRQPAPKFDLNRKGRVYTVKDSVAARSSAAPSIDLNQKQQKSYYVGREAAMRNSGVIPDLNEKERMLGGKDAAARNNAPFFDLNQISTEEEELQTNGATMTMTRIEEPRILSTLLMTRYLHMFSPVFLDRLSFNYHIFGLFYARLCSFVIFQVLAHKVKHRRKVQVNQRSIDDSGEETRV